MITIEVFRKPSDKLISQFIISGHADYDAKGRDIICSAVSTVNSFMVLYLQEAKIKHVYNIDPKENYTSLYVKESYQPLVEALFVTSLQFFKTLAKQYPKHVIVRDLLL